ncbi:primosomal protein N' [Peptoniphilus catoniae]|uniref:primosomal protein N' n=1 Tax=Peptoniphilus catoniae TaxID=1660341 RepID=UPI0010FE98DF|nr:primosomal protein N' [Peptoniphilus catoniae]
MKYLKVFIQNSISQIDSLYTYKCEDSLKIEPGMRVVVPFGRGNKKEIATVVSVDLKPDGDYKVKSIIDLVDYEPIITSDLIELGFWMSEKYLTGISKSFAPIMPPGDIKKIKRKIELIKPEELSKDDSIIIEELKKRDYSLEGLDNDTEAREKIKDLISGGIAKLDFEVESIVGKKYQNFVRLNEDYLNLIAEKSIKLTNKQEQVIKYLQAEESSMVELLRNLNISDSPVKTLEVKGLLEIYKKEILRSFYQGSYESVIHRLNLDQLKAFKGIKEDNSGTSLIYGLTGSGKTEVYLKLAEDVVASGGQVIVLLPEISLTPQMIERFKGRFNDRVSVMHSRLSLGERYDSWQQIKNSKVDVVVGARSAVFAPFKNLKMIIIDEEHDGSYRFHNALRYNTLEVAEKRMEILSGKLVLGSATPDVESYYKALEGDYKLYKLKKRAMPKATMPKTEVVDMRYELIKGNTSIFSASLRDKIEDRLKKGEQVILFLNRRGFSNFVSCRSCGYVIKCENCDISMTYHRKNNILRCHYCGSTKKPVDKCPSCGSKYIRQFGIGTQKVEEEVKKLFENAKIFRMDRDTMGEKDSYDRVYKDMKEGKIDILIGTQMLSKGLDFENVTLVGIIAADLSLFISEYRANETTFQLLTQVSGRAGRSYRGGDVVIQTYNPDNYAVEYAKDFDYESFYKKEISLRKEFLYPPFTKMINIYFSSNKEDKIEENAYDFLTSLGKNANDLYFEHTRIIRMPRIKNEYKSKITLKVHQDKLERLTNLIKWVSINRKAKLQKDNVYVDIEFI